MHLPSVALGVYLALGPLAVAGLCQASLPAEINKAIDRGIYWLLDKQRPDGSFRHGPDAAQFDKYPMGSTALIVYTLRKSGLAANDPALQKAVKWLRGQDYHKTYGVAALILALDALGGTAYDEWIGDAAEWLEESIDPRSKWWGYPGGEPDLSCTQFGALGLWTAGKHGYESSRRTWINLAGATVAFQDREGGFGYRESDRAYSQGGMTTAGITVLTLALEEISKTGTHRSRGPAREALDRAWAWMDRTFTATGNMSRGSGVIQNRWPDNPGPHMFHHYYLYGLERICAFAGRKEVAGRDWYREGAVDLLKTEDVDGGWGHFENMCFALLFLRRATFSGMSGQERVAAREASALWRFTTDAPPAGWTALEFDDSSWARGAAPFGSGSPKGAHVKTEWKTPEIWIRRKFAWKEQDGTLRLFAQFDDEFEAYVNGVLAAEGKTWSAGVHKPFEITPQAQSALTPGANVLAVRARNTGGAQAVDVRLSEAGIRVERDAQAVAAQEREGGLWWRIRPQREVPFLRRWLVLGPVSDTSGTGLIDTRLADDADIDPREGEREAGSTWRAVRSQRALLDLGEASGKRSPKGPSVYWAFTRLAVSEQTEAVLWLGADDGYRVLLDGNVLLSHHVEGGPKVDEYAVLMRLTPGIHRLLIKVDNARGACSLIARIGDPYGEPLLLAVRPFLAVEAPQLASVALAHPELFSLAELQLHLEAGADARIEFTKERELERIATGPIASDFPRWVAHSKARDAEFLPAPGGKGLLCVKPPDLDRPARFLTKVRMPEGRDTLELSVSAERKTGGPASLVRLGIFDGELHWVGETQVQPAAELTSKDWQRITADVAPFAGEEVLLIVECSTESGAPEIVFIDELLVR